MFKAGDTIICIDNEGIEEALKVSKYYTVKETGKSAIVLEEADGWFEVHHFEHVDLKRELKLAFKDYHTALNAAEEAKEAFRALIRQGDKFLWNDKPVTVVAVTAHYVIVNYDADEMKLGYYAVVEELRWVE